MAYPSPSGGISSTDASALADASVATHVALGDPHTQYLTEAAAASSYATVASVTVLEMARRMASTQYGAIMHGTSATVMTGFGLLVGSTTTTDATHSSGIDTVGRYYTQATSAASANNAGWSSATAFTEMDCPTIVVFNVSFAELTSIRFFVGLLASGTIDNASNSDTLASHGVGFQFSTARGDTALQVVSNGGSQTVATTGYTLVAGTPYSLELQIVSASSVTWRIYSAAGASLANGTISANLPAATTDLYAMFSWETQTTAAKTCTTYSCSAYTAGMSR